MTSFLDTTPRVSFIDLLTHLSGSNRHAIIDRGALPGAFGSCEAQVMLASCAEFPSDDEVPYYWQAFHGQSSRSLIGRGHVTGWTAVLQAVADCFNEHVTAAARAAASENSPA